MKLLRFAVFASGRGTNFENLARAVRGGRIRAELALLLSDHPKAPALKKAQRLGIESLCLERFQFPTKEKFEQAILRELRRRHIDFIALAGYMRILGPDLVRAYPNGILNIHPALLPAFAGVHAIQDAWNHGAKVTGVTVHFVDEKVDHGPIILQKEVRVARRDTLASLEKKIHAVEYQLYPRAIQLFVEGRLRTQGREVTVRGRGDRPH